MIGRFEHLNSAEQTLNRIREQLRLTQQSLLLSRKTRRNSV